MKRKMLILVIGLVLMTSLVVAGVTLTNKSDKSITSERKTAIENYLSAKGLSTDIKVEQSNCIQIDDDYCKWSAVLNGVIKSYNNPLDLYKHQCKGNIFNESTGECVEPLKIAKTDQEISDEIDNEIERRINKFADSLIAKEEKSYTDRETGGILTFK